MATLNGNFHFVHGSWAKVTTFLWEMRGRQYFRITWATDCTIIEAYALSDYEQD